MKRYLIFLILFSQLHAVELEKDIVELVGSLQSIKQELPVAQPNLGALLEQIKKAKGPGGLTEEKKKRIKEEQLRLIGKEKAELQGNIQKLEKEIKDDQNNFKAEENSREKRARDYFLEKSKQPGFNIESLRELFKGKAKEFKYKVPTEKTNYDEAVNLYVISVRPLIYLSIRKPGEVLWHQPEASVKKFLDAIGEDLKTKKEAFEASEQQKIKQKNLLEQEMEDFNRKEEEVKTGKKIKAEEETFLGAVYNLIKSMGGSYQEEQKKEEPEGVPEEEWEEQKESD